MFAKPAFILRSLFVAATLASLVACSFDGEQPDDEKGSTSALHKDQSGADAGSSKGKNKGADAGAYDGADASADVDGGPWNGGADAGWSGDDDDSADAGAGWGSDDDGHLGLDDGGAGHWGTDAGF